MFPLWRRGKGRRVLREVDTALLGVRALGAVSRDSGAGLEGTRGIGGGAKKDH